jgi:hypothetical protein
MRLEHITGMEAGYTMGMEPGGRELLVVCIKGTFSFPEQEDAEPPLAEQQEPLVEADTFTGEPGFSAPVYESDYAPYKPFCDVLLHGSAYAPNGRAVEKVTVAMQVGKMSKTFAVVGDRVWVQNCNSRTLYSPPLAFTTKKISYDTAFGGTDTSHQDPAKIHAFMNNPVGAGFQHHLESEFIHGKPLPNTEELHQPVSDPRGSYRPMSFGPIGRGWQPRSRYGGTYDQNWIDNIFPFLPPDFDSRYYQAAPTDQQIPYPQGGEPVGLLNLTPEGRTVFRLPKKNMLVWFLLQNGEEINKPALLDTIILEPDARRFMLVWRAALPLKRNMFEVEMVVIGDNPDARKQVLPDEYPAFPWQGEESESTEAA